MTRFVRNRFLDSVTADRGGRPKRGLLATSPCHSASYSYFRTREVTIDSNNAAAVKRDTGNRRTSGSVFPLRP